MNETDNLKIDFNYFPFLNLAMVQNKYPVAKGIVIENSGTETLENLTLMITPGADFAAEFKSEIAKIEPGEKIDLSESPLGSWQTVPSAFIFSGGQYPSEADLSHPCL